MRGPVLADVPHPGHAAPQSSGPPARVVLTVPQVRDAVFPVTFDYALTAKSSQRSCDLSRISRSPVPLAKPVVLSRHQQIGSLTSPRACLAELPQSLMRDFHEPHHPASVASGVTRQGCLRQYVGPLRPALYERAHGSSSGGRQPASLSAGRSRSRAAGLDHLLHAEDPPSSSTTVTPLMRRSSISNATSRTGASGPTATTSFTIMSPAFMAPFYSNAIESRS